MTICQTKLLRRRGWTRGLLNFFLPVADRTCRNPRHWNGVPMRLFDIGRVLRVERSPEFIARQEKLAARRRKRAYA
jgi:hypothetical protein